MKRRNLFDIGLWLAAYKNTFRIQFTFHIFHCNWLCGRSQWIRLKIRCAFSFGVRLIVKFHIFQAFDILHFCFQFDGKVSSCLFSSLLSIKYSKYLEFSLLSKVTRSRNGTKEKMNDRSNGIRVFQLWNPFLSMDFWTKKMFILCKWRSRIGHHTRLTIILPVVLLLYVVCQSVDDVVRDNNRINIIMNTESLWTVPSSFCDCFSSILFYFHFLIRAMFLVRAPKIVWRCFAVNEMPIL